MPKSPLIVDNPIAGINATHYIRMIKLRNAEKHGPACQSQQLYRLCVYFLAMPFIQPKHNSS